jgi:membrane protein YdbS with pleckstrin-like domain
MCFFFLIVGLGLGVLLFSTGAYLFFCGISAAYFLSFLVLLLSRISFNKKGFAFRTRCSFKHGILATNIIVIPYNRVQHVALHEGFISRYWQNRSFTAGGSASDIEIPELKKKRNIKQLLMGKFKTTVNEE